ncbi:borealin-2 isoform X6 [Electrophorus electricus]|uniref:borealin-2 isoform X6 n=1 Tax=Electrophorus electricus TaxID=8005 RepID=UPI0015CFAA7C|nr:borealin-2 isoform X6 [Electrophorus electricus]
MAARKTRKVSRNSNENDCYSGDKLKKRKELFIQQFEKEAQERVNEMEAKLDKVLTTLDRAFKIEMMKLPQSLHTTLIKDLMTGKASNTAVQEPLMGQIKTEETSKRRTKIKMHPSNSTGSLRGASTTSAKRPHGRVKLSDQAHPLGIKMSVTNRSLSDDLSGIATATIMTSHGETLLLSEETKDDVKLELLDDMALCQIQKIKVGMVNAECVFLLHNYKMTSDYLLGFRS